MNKQVVVFGTGHLACRIKKILTEKDFSVIELSDEKIKRKNQGIFKNDELILNNIQGDIEYVFIVEDEDDKNIEFFIMMKSSGRKTKIFMSIFNMKIGQHIKQLHSDVCIVNPGEISADTFVQGISENVECEISYDTPLGSTFIKDISLSKTILYLLLVFLFVVIMSTLFFSFNTRLDLVDSLYFVIVTIATVGYGDINVLQESAGIKIYCISLIIFSMVFVGYSFSVVMNEILKKREAVALGIRKHKIKNHVIVCGLGRTGFFVVEKLLQQGEKVIIVEINKEAPFLEYFKSKGAFSYIGDATIPKTLQDVNVLHAKALIALVNNDSRNLEIGLNGRSLFPRLKLILRIYEKSISEEIKKVFNIQLAYSVSEITAQNLVLKISS